MNIRQYNKILRSYKIQIEELIEERKQFVLQNKELIEKQIKEEQSANKEWFIKNFDIIWQNRSKFMQNTPYADIKIDFFSIYHNRYNKNPSLNIISICDLITLWDIGFKYNGYPILELDFYRFDAVKISYIKNNELVEIQIDRLSDRQQGTFKEEPNISPIVLGALEYMANHNEEFKDENIVNEYQTIADMKEILAV